jgi:hypothetical protein
MLLQEQGRLEGMQQLEQGGAALVAAIRLQNATGLKEQHDRVLDELLQLEVHKLPPLMQSYARLNDAAILVVGRRPACGVAGRGAPPLLPPPAPPLCQSPPPRLSPATHYDHPAE